MTRVNNLVCIWVVINQTRMLNCIMFNCIVGVVLDYLDFVGVCNTIVAVGRNNYFWDGVGRASRVAMVLCCVGDADILFLNNDCYLRILTFLYLFLS